MNFYENVADRGERRKERGQTHDVDHALSLTSVSP